MTADHTPATSWRDELPSLSRGQWLTDDERIIVGDKIAAAYTHPDRPSMAAIAAATGRAQSSIHRLLHEALEGRLPTRTVVDEQMAAQARRLRKQGQTVPKIAAQLTIRSGHRKGKSPSVTTVYRILAPGREERGQHSSAAPDTPGSGGRGGRPQGVPPRLPSTPRKGLPPSAPRTEPWRRR
ncbi:hypothetical protein GCM10009578_065790 [Streptomyces rhizosphaericus]